MIPNRLGEMLGSGQFGVWKSKGGDVEVAVKSLKIESTKEEKIKFLQEGTVQSSRSSHNIWNSNKGGPCKYLFATVSLFLTTVAM